MGGFFSKVGDFLKDSAGDILSLGGDIVGGILGNKESEKDRDMQREFAQQGVRWKVADAKAAGLHPLAALGVSAPSASPVGSNIPDYSKFGQNIQRARMAKATAAERELQKLDIERANLVNDGLLLDNLKKNRSLTEAPPKMPSTDWEGIIPGQGDSQVSPFVNIVPKDQTAASATGVEVGAGPLEQKFSMQDGSIIYAPGKEASEPMESSMPTQMAYTGYKVGSGVDNWKRWYYNKPSKQMLAQWRDLMKNNPPKKGYVWRMKKGRWFQVKAGKASAGSLFAPQWINSRRNYRKKVKRPPKWYGWEE